MIGGARGGRAEALLAHGFAQFLVVDHFARAFHGGEERGFVEAGRRLGVAFLDLDRFDAARSRRRRSATSESLFALGLASVNLQPAGLYDDLAVGLEFLRLDGGDARGELELRRRDRKRR